ncbi:MAG: D-alanyl-D-alanine carboxypeptidase [Erysipelotrichaceae bacterium]|nr:D-alanyl-D-alanine carboxypeptidase [Erysipelotrichaceae bacterium]
MMKKTVRKMMCIMMSVMTAMTVFFTMVRADNYQLDIDLMSDYAYVYDMAHDIILLDKNSEERMYPASMTKIMTEILALEHYTNMDREIVITYPMIEGLREAEATRIAYQPGDVATVRDLLYGVMLPSAADSCHALAITLDGSLSAFADRMNRKAKELGLKDTHFVNSSGLHDDRHYSTCRDIAKLMEYCLQNEKFVEIMKTEEYVTNPTYYDPEGCDIYNGTLRGFKRRNLPAPGLVGGKTGFTDEALQCLVCYAELNDMKLIIVTAHGSGTSYMPAHFGDVSNILCELNDWHYARVIDDRQLQQTITIHHQFSDETIEILNSGDVNMIVPDARVVRTETDFDDEYDSGLEAVEKKGMVTVWCNDQIIDEREMTIVIPRERNILGIAIKFFKKLFR